MVARQKCREGTERWGRGEIVPLPKVQADCSELPADERQPLKAAQTTDQHGSVVDCEEHHSLKAASAADSISTSGVESLSTPLLVGVSPIEGQVVPDQVAWKELLLASPDVAQFGAGLGWGMARGYVFPGFDLIASLVKPVATQVAFKRYNGLFPLPCSLNGIFNGGWPAGGFGADQCAQAWTCLAAAAINHLHGEKPPFPKHRGGAAVKKALDTLGSRVVRFLTQKVDSPLKASDVWSELREKSVSYSGEEIALAQPLTVDQIVNSLPPVGHGGSVELAPLLVGRSRFLIEHPEQVLLRGDQVKPGKNKSKVHIAAGDEIKLFRLLFQRGVIDFIPEGDVFSDDNGPFLSGLFGVPKPGKISPGGNPVLRLIMNLIPINRALDVILGDIEELPSAAIWQQLVLFDGSSISISQADMSSAFYLFRLPPTWLRYMAFNFRLKRNEVGLSGPGFVYPACRVLPMGWSSSVGLMQMASRELIRRASIPHSDELRRGSVVPPWFVQILQNADPHHSWWQVYLDNFMSAEVARVGSPRGLDLDLHTAAVDAWGSHGVLCSEDKHVRQAEVATELGVQINGPGGLLGASSSRIYKTLLATLALLVHGPPRVKHLQILLGRWIFILQYRRVAMSALSQSWDYLKPGKRRKHLWRKVCEELSHLVMLTPLIQFDLLTGFNPVVTCSDASESGGAVALATGLSPAGCELASRISCGEMEPLPAELLVISCFNGLGGCFRAYDLVGIRPAALISIEIDKAAKRVVRITWPHALEIHDINDVTREMVTSWANMFPRVKEVHAWGGFPCVHLSSARAGRMNLAGEGSNLFFKLVEVIELLEEVFTPRATVEFVIENVFSMDVSARQEISARLAIKPLKLDPSDCSPISRPRLAWISKEVVATPGVTLIDHGDYVEVSMEGLFPDTASWIRPGWRLVTKGVTFPTFMKSIRRFQPPPSPAGLSRCDQGTINRWRSDEFRFPPYQYALKFLLVNTEGQLRYLNAQERELLLGLGLDATKFCFSASASKSHPVDFWDKRLSLLGDTFAMLSFGWLAGQLAKPWVDPISPQHLINRFGLAPGASLHPQAEAPLNRDLRYGIPIHESSDSLLVGHISRFVSHNGSDVSLALGIPFSSKQGHHSIIRAPWWDWKILFSTKWEFSDHINALEMRMILQAAHWRCRGTDHFNTRWLHLADSMVCNYILSKGRTSSRLLQPLVRKLAAVQLALNALELHGHVDSAENPTDAASRA